MMMLTGTASRHSSSRMLAHARHYRVTAPRATSSRILASITGTSCSCSSGDGSGSSSRLAQSAYSSHQMMQFSSTLKSAPSTSTAQAQNNLSSRTLATAITIEGDTTAPSSSAPSPSGKNPLPDFNDAKAAYESKTNGQLVRAVLSFSLCQVPILVRNSEAMLKLSRKVVGDTITNTVLKQTIFGHFCAGEDEKRILPAIADLAKAGIGSILDFAAEDDGEGDSDSDSADGVKAFVIDENTALKIESEIADEIIVEEAPKVRIYGYESEAKCDRHVETFKQCINTVSKYQADGYAAIKVTALGNPKLLERMSLAIVEAQNLFAKFDSGGDGMINRDEFEAGFQEFFRIDDTKLKRMIAATNPDESGDVDYITWSMMLQPRDIPRIVRGCKENGPLAMASPTEEEVELIEKMYARGHALAKEAAACGTRLLIDAEQARFQPAIDSLVLELQRTYNSKSVSDYPIIYNTYQCYLKDVPERLAMDVERSERFDYHFGAKMVRGAYMESERALAETLGNPSPIHDTIEDTHNCYNNAVDFLLEHAVKSDKQVELMVASHNQGSIEKAIESMNKHGIDRRGPTISFGQLFGMSDNLTFNLGKHGYRAYKYVPYGEVKMVMPYLIRRANENSSIASAAVKELRMISGELSRRVTGKKKAAA